MDRTHDFNFIMFITLATRLQRGHTIHYFKDILIHYSSIYIYILNFLVVYFIKAIHKSSATYPKN